MSILFAALLMTACNRPKEWTVEGTFDIPDTIQYGDTFFLRPPLDGMYVYLISLDGDILDSAQVAGGSFAFKGETSEPRLRYLACEYCVGTVVLEPGEIHVIMSENFEASGTPANEGITDLESRLADLESDARDQVLALSGDDASAPASDSVQALMFGVYMNYISRVGNTIDSVTKAHPQDLIGVYAWGLKVGPAETAAMLDTMLVEASDFVRNSELIQSRRRYLANVADDAAYFNPEDLGLEEGEEPEAPADGDDDDRLMPPPPGDEDGMPGPPPPPEDEDARPAPPPGDNKPERRPLYDEYGLPIPPR